MSKSEYKRLCVQNPIKMAEELALTKQKLEAAEQDRNGAVEQFLGSQTALRAAQLHSKELRELLAEAAESVQEWGNYADDYFQEKWNLAGDVEKYKQAVLSARQPDTRALDKVLLEAEIARLKTAKEICKPYGEDFAFMITEREAKLAELIKE